MPRDTVHPGKILWEEFMKPDGISVAELSDALGVPDAHIQAMACCRFRGHQVKVFYEAGGWLWRGAFSVVSSR